MAQAPDPPPPPVHSLFMHAEQQAVAKMPHFTKRTPPNSTALPAQLTRFVPVVSRRVEDTYASCPFMITGKEFQMGRNVCKIAAFRRNVKTSLLRLNHPGRKHLAPTAAWRLILTEGN